MNKKEKLIYTKTYLLKSRGLTTREVQLEIRKRYSYSINKDLILKKFPNLSTNDRRYKYSTLEKKMMLNLYSNFYNTDKVVEYLFRYKNIKITTSQIIQLASRNGISKNIRNVYKNSSVSYSEEKEIVLRYISGETANDLSKDYNFQTKESIYNKLKKHGHSPSHYNKIRIDASKGYMDFSLSYIDSKEKAYFLGLLLTDGCLHQKRKVIELSLTDEDAIEYLSQYINCKYNTYIRPGNTLPMHRIYLYHPKLYDELICRGITPRKTLTLNGPLLNEEELLFIPDIIRGIIDGDGWIKEDGKEFFICSASIEFIEWCKEKLEDLGMVELKITQKKDGVYNIRSAVFSNVLILQEIYKEEYGMFRKRNRLIKE